MKYIVLLIFLISCAHLKHEEEDNLVTVHTALEQAQMSYLRGCVDALKDMKVPITFEGCRDKSELHRQEIESIMEAIPYEKL